MGGYTTGKKEIIEMLRQKSRPYLFSNSLAPSIVGAANKVFDILSSSTALRDKLEANTKYFKDRIVAAGFDVKEGDSPIVPIMLYDAALSQKFAEGLLKEGVYAIGFFYPVVPKGKARIRTQISAAHEIHHLDKAIADYQSAVKIDSKLAFSHNNLGSAYRKKEQWDKAIESYSKAIEIDKDYAIAINNRGMAYFSKKDYDKAKADFDKAISLKADYALAYNNRASIYIEKEEWNLAVKDCNRAIEINKELAYAYYNRAIAKEMLRDLDNACLDWQKSHELGLDAGKTQMNTWCNK